MSKSGKKRVYRKVGMHDQIFFRCTVDQKKALEAYVAMLNKKREKEGQESVGLGTWLRELALKHSGNDHLTVAAQALAAARAAAEKGSLL